MRPFNMSAPCQLSGVQAASRRERHSEDVIRKEACFFERTIFGVRLCWELEEPKGPKKAAAARETFAPSVRVMSAQTSHPSSHPLQEYLAHKKHTPP